MVARQYHTDHHEIVVRPDAVDLVSRLVRHFDEPFGDSSAIPTFIVSEFAVQHVKVALSGDGGDELFAGYDRFQALEKLRRFDRSPHALRTFVSWIADRLPYSAYGKNYLHMLSRSTALERYFESNFAPWLLREELLEPDWMLPADGAYLTRALAGFLLPGDADLLSQALYFETTQNLPGDMLVKVDRMSMANSLEVRCPVLDHELAELAASIPHGWKIRKGKASISFCARWATACRRPVEPAQNGFRRTAVLVVPRYAARLPLGSPDQRIIPCRGIVSPAFVRQMLAEHDAGRRDNSHWLWSLLMLELWFRKPPARRPRAAYD